jgi:hypothetical protein
MTIHTKLFGLSRPDVANQVTKGEVCYVEERLPRVCCGLPMLPVVNGECVQFDNLFTAPKASQQSATLRKVKE